VPSGLNFSIFFGLTLSDWVALSSHCGNYGDDGIVINVKEPIVFCREVKCTLIQVAPFKGSITAKYN